MKTPDRTRIAVTRQLKAMAASVYDVGLFHRATDKMLPRLWTSEQILNSLGWLKAQNRKGCDIFIRPQGSMGLVFFDDVDRKTLEAMKMAGHEPAVLIESSPLNYHGWLRITDSPISESLATAVCKTLAKIYKSDSGSADWRHYGRLAGFTNQKKQYCDENGRQPFVLLSEARGRKCIQAEELLELAQDAISLKQLPESQSDNQSAKKTPASPTTYFQSQLAGLIQRYGVQLDASRADWMIVSKMVSIGYSRGEVREALEKHSPALESRRGRIEKYLTVTLDNAFKGASHVG